MNSIRTQICKTALQAVEVTRQRRLRDLERVRLRYERLGIDSIDEATMVWALNEMENHIESVARVAQRFQNSQYVTWNQQSVPAEESHYSSWLLGIMKEYFPVCKSELLKTFKRAQNPKEFQAMVFEAAGQDTFFEDALVSGPDSGPTGYEAKSFLCYALPLAERRSLFSELELRFDLRDVAPESDVPFMNALAGDSPYACSVLTDGYFYGALRANAKAFVSGTPNALGMGIDCSTLVQETYESAGVSNVHFKSPISTRHIVRGDMPGLQTGVFEMTRLLSADVLVPGDAILWEGHIITYIGRDSLNRLRIIEAVGRRFRTVREAIFPLFDNTAGGISVFSHPERPLYHFRAAVL